MANKEHSLAPYVADILALEQYVHVVFAAQKSDREFSEYQNAADIVSRLDALSDQHIDALSIALQELGGHEPAGIRTALAEVGGALAGAIDKARKTKVSKALRDDYAALAVSIVSYEELLTTANALNNPDIVGLAQRHLTDYANAMMETGEGIPASVVRELTRTGVDVDPVVVEQSREAIRQCWQQTTRAPHEPSTTRGIIEYEREYAQGDLL